MTGRLEAKQQHGGILMRLISFTRIALAVLGVTLSQVSQVLIGPAIAQSCPQKPSYVDECRKCLESATGETGKKAVIAGLFGALAGAGAGSAVPVLGTVAGAICGGISAATATAVNDLVSASSCAASSACAQTAVWMKEQRALAQQAEVKKAQRLSIVCSIDRPAADPKKCAQKIEYRTKTVIKNGLGETVNQSCSSDWKCGDVRPKCSTTDRCP
jgi:hypothetical protein